VYVAKFLMISLRLHSGTVKLRFSARIAFHYCCVTMPSLVVPAKRSHNDVDDVARLPAPARFKPTHPHTILDYLVEEVLPRKCITEGTKLYYRSQIENPRAAVDECKRLHAGWVVEFWEKKQLRSVVESDYRPLRCTSLNSTLMTSSSTMYPTFSYAISFISCVPSFLFTVLDLFVCTNMHVV
jgi:hypothetical protein